MNSDSDSKTGPSSTATSASPGLGLSPGSGLPLHSAQPLAAAVDDRRAVAATRDALFLDVDGTLLEIAPHPDEVRVPSSLRDVLERLANRFGGAVALVSGRSIANIDALFAPLRLPCAGIHGLERRGADAVLHRGDAGPLLWPLRAPLADFVRAHPGLLLEDKGQSLALHYRNAPACGPAAEALLQALIGPGPSPLELKRGKMVLEVKPCSADKGTAIAAFMGEPPFIGRRPVFIGDDVTDEDGFIVVNALGGLSIRVGSEQVGSAAPHRLADEAAVLSLLRRWSDDVQGGEPH